MPRPFRVAPICVAGVIAIACGCERRPPLTTIVSGGEGPPTFVLLHGYGSSAERWAPFTRTIRWPAPGRFVFPQGPDVMVRTDGGQGGRAWWPLAIASYIPQGTAVADLSGVRPPGLKAAASMVEDLLDDRNAVPRGPVVLGGFSQGAMVASEVAFGTHTPLSALVILSGTIVDEQSWVSHLRERRGLPVFVAHGRQDRTLPFGAADRLRQELEAAGLQVTWFPFDGGHDMPESVIVALNDFLTRLHLGP
jgi:phospholipase/carboxylesterase